MWFSNVPTIGRADGGKWINYWGQYEPLALRHHKVNCATSLAHKMPFSTYQNWISLAVFWYTSVCDQVTDEVNPGINRNTLSYWTFTTICMAQIVSSSWVEKMSRRNLIVNFCQQHQNYRLYLPTLRHCSLYVTLWIIVIQSDNAISDKLWTVAFGKIEELSLGIPTLWHATI